MLHLKNYMEEIVESYLNKVMGEMKMCICEKCKADVMALALNSLPTKYVVTKQGEVYLKLNLLIQQFEIDVISAITKGAKVVKEKPRH